MSASDKEISARYCGGKTKESVYEMHDCNAVAYKPTDPNEAMVRLYSSLSAKKRSTGLLT